MIVVVSGGGGVQLLVLLFLLLFLLLLCCCYSKEGLFPHIFISHPSPTGGRRVEGNPQRLKTKTKHQQNNIILRGKNKNNK